MNLFSIEYRFLIFETTAFLLCLFYFKRILNSRIKPLPFYLFMILLFDGIAYYRTQNGLDNHWINQVVIPFEFCSLLLLCRSFLSSIPLKKITPWLLLLYLTLFAADEWIYKPSYTWLYLRSYIAGVITLLVAVVLYGYDLLTSDKLNRFYQQPEFWICTGILLFYIGTLPFHLVWNFASEKFRKSFESFRPLFFNLLSLLYILFSIAVLCLKPKNK